MSEWEPQKPKDVINPEIELKLLDIANEAVSDIYAKHDNSRQDNRFTSNGVLLPKLTIIDAVGLLDQEIEGPLDRSMLQDALAVMGADAGMVQRRFAENNINVTPVLAASLEIGEGTENNLPWYHAEQFATFKNHKALVEMLGGWTSEEATHGELVELVMTGAGLYDEKKSVDIQTSLLRGGISVETMSLAAINAYTDPQERLTFIAHQSSARLAGESGGKALLKLAGQENRHKTMFRALGKAMYETGDPEVIDYLLRMDAAVMHNFSMPGSKSFPGYKKIASILSSTGLFTFNHMIESFAERAKSLKLEELEPVSDEAKKAQSWILDFTQLDSQLHTQMRRIEGRQKSMYKKAAEAEGVTPFIVGETVELDKTEFKPAV